MNWTKVTDALPPEGEDVIVTILDDDGSKIVRGDIYFSKRDGWMQPYGEDVLPVSSFGRTVTHWTPMPAPAED